MKKQRLEPPELQLLVQHSALDAPPELRCPLDLFNLKIFAAGPFEAIEPRLPPVTVRLPGKKRGAPGQEHSTFQSKPMADRTHMHPSMVGAMRL